MPIKRSKIGETFKNLSDVSCYVRYLHKDSKDHEFEFDFYDSKEYAYKLRKVLSQYGVKVIIHPIYSNMDSDLIRDAFHNTLILILIGTRDDFNSKWVKFELDYYRQLNKSVFPILLNNDLPYEVIPTVLKDMDWVKENVGKTKGKPSNVLVVELLEVIASSQNYQSSDYDSTLSQQKRKEKRPLNEGKLIFVGRGEVGKTSIVKRLVEKTFQGDESKTQGINITSWSLPCSTETYQLNIWDFGGQEIMHATHQFFLTEQSLYLLVLNGREGGEDLDSEYWLKHIESFGSDSPVIVVQNKITQHPFDLNYRGLQSRYPQIRGFVKTDCKDEIGLNELIDLIKKVIDEIPEFQMLFPDDWFKVKKKLESMKVEYMGLEQFNKLCMEEGIQEELDQDTLRWVLHCLGIALNYRNDSRLRDTSVLKPEWVTQGIYSILNAKKLAEQQGELHLNDLRQILPKERYPQEKHLFILELMRKFSLCFAFPDEEDKYLIPELLGKEEPEEVADFSPVGCLNFEYQYAILPEGLIPRFIVRSHTLSHNQQRWRTGVILAYEDCKALVTINGAERKVIIRLKGSNARGRRNLLAIIRYDFDGINAEFKDRLEAQPKVPLRDFPELSIDYKKLVAFETQGVTSFPEFIGQKVIKVKVNELLNGVDLDKQRKVSTEPIYQSKAVFFCYSHKDESLRDELEIHLKLLERQNVISTWYDRKILTGSKWDREIDNRLERASIILLLISADFIASDYCWDIEIKRAMELHELGKATVIPISLRKCDWKGAPFAKLQGLPKDMKPITLFDDRDSGWTEVASGIRLIAERR